MLIFQNQHFQEDNGYNIKYIIFEAMVQTTIASKILNKYRIILLLVFFVLIVSCNKSEKQKTLSNTTAEQLLARADNSASGDNSQKLKLLDSAYSEFEGEGHDSLAVKFYRNIASSYYDINQYPKSLKSSRKSYKLAASINDTIGMAKALHIQGVAFYENKNKDSAFAKYNQAEKLYAKINAPDVAGIILYKAYIYYDIGDYVLCETEAVRALRLFRLQKWNLEIHNANNLIAAALDGQNNYEGAITYYQAALDQLEYFKQDGYTDDMIAIYRASCLNNMGLVYIEMQQPEKAIAIYNDVLSYDTKKYSPELYARLINNYASAKLKKGDFRGLPGLFYKSLKIRDSLGIMSDVIASRYKLGEYYLARKDSTLAVKYFKSAYREAKTIKSSYDILKTLKILGDVDKKDNIAYTDIYIHVNDSIQQRDKANRNRFARIAYETDRLESEKEELNRKNTFIIGLSVVVLLFLAAIFMIYYLNSRNKKLILIQEQQRANEEIYQLMFEQQSKVDTARAEEKNRIAMELHDGILNNIYAVRLNLEFTNRKTDQESIDKRKGFIKELQLVEGEIRAVSHELSRNVIFEQNQSFESILGFMVTSQKNTFGTEFEALIDRDIDWENIPNTSKINIYRIIQEALQNINKYAEAQHAIVNIMQEKQTIKVMVTDDGAGFDTAKAAEGIGLKNLKKRTEALNGTITIESEPGHGTAIMVHFSV
jgi:signal transduction histidine kinase